ncbi:tRNA N6-adenosine threonylcarbamoyltransferase, mitochondrial [Adelges cooleyi]|uniref:tRNA N6-adenosine threonylcarbamoyltransferase, mitochondrial n=1 Tax=Adelges cooleyi TaxID=133065 RepID=UPI00217FBB1D|nr:tRNA N6-adenosine threonylcarbamoyltransferase, mitochondrial [Adelges cooleyi]XP_050429866.1 tRNA N6-adenosine threonylcarbamoyltransferase, mitochondrial [Adelges cooleyi]XP_050429867.1 tRNA N6-adenosine threonylcarbamoyltransferase, mitochondrial [Adelges cooleyi]XP_050429868.1 tRNA N6-adenosine threonylcarbamoyltransferase, mitochondrial [Adelges cooleyi]
MMNVRRFLGPSHFIFNTNVRYSHKTCRIMGIETSCDDTGCAIVDSHRNIVSEFLHSQQETHINFGGIIPPIARNLHKEHIERVVTETLKQSHFTLQDVDAIAVTIKPGLSLSLLVGMNYAKHLCRISSKPLIPIHHMEAHALTARLTDENLQMPFLVLLISGGHCLLAVVKNVDTFLLLGQSVDDAPGEALDKAARRLQLKNFKEFRHCSGGQAIERAATKGDAKAIDLGTFMTGYKDCNFSFSGLKNTIRTQILKFEKKHDIKGDEIIPEVYDLCASIQYSITKHICTRVQRAMEFIDRTNMIPKNNRTLVISGGVASNMFIRKYLNALCDDMAYNLSVPPPALCTDNGVMIAWNGIEKFSKHLDIFSHDNLDKIDILPKAPLGKDISQEVSDMNIRCPSGFFNKLYNSNK